MLELRKITKVYETADLRQTALNKVSINFRENEFVSILGPSGSGKTTLLNIIGGLDKYDSGDLIINEVSTKDFKDRDWDSYRNHRVGFVFQSYNLISHQSILQNVELALTLSGVSKTERTKRAKKALKDVGLEKHINKHPNQLSGGQMQRVAIARALVNDPDIVLADEPTGALDTATSDQIMKLLKKVANDKLVIMVTHNPDLAKAYSTRIIKIQDGSIISDSRKYDGHVDTKESLEEERRKSTKTSMNLKTALGLSLNNLMTKKGRTILTAFAGSIGIIGIALILSLSNGIQNYIDRTEKETLTEYPVTLQKQSVDYAGIIATFMSDDTSGTEHEDDKIYAMSTVSDIFNSISDGAATNDLKSFKEYIETGDGKDIDKYVSAINYGWNIDVNLYKTGTDDVVRVNPTTFMDAIGMSTSGISSAYGSMMSSYDIFSELQGTQEMLDERYDVIAGRWPEKYNELVLSIGEDNEISDYTLYTLGLLDQTTLKENFNAVISGQETHLPTGQVYNYDDFLGLSFKLIPTVKYYKKSGNFWVDARDDESYVKSLLKDATEVKIVGIVKPGENSVLKSHAGLVGYTHELAEYIINQTNASGIAKDQLAHKDINVLTGAKFGESKDFELSDLSPDQQAYLSSLSTSELADLMTAYKENAVATYETNLMTLGIANLGDPDYIYLYPKNFDSKAEIESIISRYNEGKPEEEQLTYTDVVGTLISSVSIIVDVVSAVLIAFVAVSLIVSSIMIAIITYISVLERTKEIGILRAIGASKRDISRVFNAETLIEGFVAGVLGILVTLLLNIPINIIIKAVTDISGIAALPTAGAIILIIISVVLTLVAGLIPASMASKKDPVEALRSE